MASTSGLWLLLCCAIADPAKSDGLGRHTRCNSPPLGRSQGALNECDCRYLISTQVPAVSSTDTIFAAAVNVRGGGDEENTSILQRHPFECAVAITTCNAVAADLLAQLVVEQKPWNPKRSLLFSAFGFLYQGCAQYFIVNLGWERLFPGTKPRNVLAKIAGMNFVSDPLLFMPTFYIFRETLLQGALSVKTATLAFEKYRENCLLDWRNSWLVWLPGHAVTYGVMSPHKRIPWMAVLSFFYMCILSVTRGATTPATAAVVD